MKFQDVPNFIEVDGEIMPNNEGTSSDNPNGAIFPGRGERDRVMPHDFSGLTDPSVPETLSDRLETIETLGAITCADCGQIIPCPHAGYTPSGKGFTKGY